MKRIFDFSNINSRICTIPGELEIKQIDVTKNEAPQSLQFPPISTLLGLKTKMKGEGVGSIRL